MSARLPQFYLIGYTMDSIKALEKIGLREVSRKTYIELSYLQLMADRDFAKLHRIKTLGFVKIIKRECGIDMSDWVAEFEAYLQEQADGSKVKKDDPLIVEKWYADNQKRFYVVIIALVLIVIITIFYLLLKTRTVYIEDTSSYTNIVVTDESLQNDENDVENSNDVKNSTEEIIDDDKMIQSKLDEAVEESVPPVIEQTTPVKPISTQTASIVPNIEIWVGVIDLATFKRSTYLQDGDIELDINKEQIIITGHGDFSLKIDDEIVKRFNPRNMVYLYVRDGTVKQISEDEFVRINRGTIW
jgi:cell division protein FtsL